MADNAGSYEPDCGLPRPRQLMRRNCVELRHMRTLIPSWVCAMLVVCLAARADAKAAYAGKTEMVKRSVGIAVVEVVAIEKVEVKGKYWTYRQRADARVEMVLKGELPKDKGAATVLYGEEDFICAQCRFEPGRYLVFLNQDAGLWVGANWHLSIRPIKTDAEGKETVEWYTGEKTIELKEQPLADVLAEVRKLIDAGNKQE